MVPPPPMAFPVALERLPPHDIEAEEAVIAALLVDVEALHKVLPILKAQDFFREKNGWVYEAALALWNRDEAVNQITVAHELARLDRLEFFSDSAPRPAQAVPLVLDDCEVYLPLLGLLDLDAEREKLHKELAQAQEEVAQVQRKLSNQSFVEKAPTAVVEKERARLEAAGERATRLRARLKELE